MTDYISREAALEITTRTCGDYAAAFAEIRKLPAADVASVRHGCWIGEGDGYADGELVYDVWNCSECDYCIDDGTDDPECLPKYCPGCGAKMDGGNENG